MTKPTETAQFGKEMKTPFIPLNAPYSDTQRAWLNGFFAGMHSHMLHSAGSINASNTRTLHIQIGRAHV